MDWIDEKLHIIKERLKMHSIKSTLTVYLIVAIIGVIIGYLATMVFCNGWRGLIYEKYTTNTYVGIPFVYEENLQEHDKILLIIIDLIEKSSVLVYSIIAIIGTSNIFYRNRIEEPIAILKEEANHIRRNDLSFSCVYKSGDEMGEICHGFEEMRLQLVRNKESLWSIMESQRQLNSAFAHDLRTPLTVIQGYIEFLRKYYPQGKITEEKLISTLDMINGEVHRLHGFTNTMKDINNIDAIEINKKEGKLNKIYDKVQAVTVGLELRHNIKINTVSNVKDVVGYYDEGIILQVIDNLLSNGISYGRDLINVIIDIEDSMLIIYVKDDGVGFTKEDLYYATKPYYSNRKENKDHYGIGLTMCKLLCEKHGGTLQINNSTEGGAIVSATFLVNIDKK